MQLPELQRSLRSSLLGAPDPRLLECIEADALSAEERLSIYRHTITGTLTKALRLNFPAVEKLVGTAFFAQCAESYVAIEPPRSGYLNDFGAGFAAHLATDPQVATLPYLLDVARLEWAVSRALIAESPPAADLAALAALDPCLHEQVCFSAHPSLSLLTLATPADMIWQAVLAGDDAALAAIELASSPVQVLVERLGTELSVRRLAPPEWAFAQALCSGMPLGSALLMHPDIDVQGQLALHLGAGRLRGWQLRPTQADTAPRSNLA